MSKRYKRYIILGMISCIIMYGFYMYYINMASDRNSNELKVIETMRQTDTQENKEPPKLQLYATSAILMDASNYRVLYEKNGYEMLPMASTTKIMTLIVALENGNMSDLVTVSNYAAKMPDVQLNIREGEEYKLEDLLYSLMLESHNDSAVAIAEHIGGSVEGFAAMMNQKAQELGCMDTYYITPNGLDATKQEIDQNGDATQKTHSTTASDLGRIMSYCIMESPQKEEFLKITRTQTYSFQDKEGRRSFTCNNHNAFLNMMEGALSGKTGFTGAAGYCYVGALEQDGRTFVVALLACGWPNNRSYKWSDTKKLMQYGLDNYFLHQINEDKKELEPIEVIDGQKAKVKIGAIEKEITLLVGKEEQTRVEYDIPDFLAAPIQEKEVVGNIKYYIDDLLYDAVPIYTTDSVKRIDYAYCFEKVCNIWLLRN